MKKDMQKSYLKPLYAILLVLSCSCASVPDVPICAEVSISRGMCTYTVSGKTINVSDEELLDGQTWFDIRAKALTLPASSWAKIKSFLIKQCKQNKCDVDIDSWDREIAK
jgi:hypothetical protein